MSVITSIKQQKKQGRVNVYIDESGIFRNEGFSVYCITVIDSDYSGFIDSEILKIEKKLKILPFHWRDHIWKIKTKFLKEIIKIDNWKCILVVIGNKNYSNVIFEESLAKALQGVEIKSMFIDGKKHKTYVFDVKRSLKKLGVKVRSLKLVNDQSKGGLRISDAVAGLSRLNYDKKNVNEAKVYFNKFLRNKITTQIVSGY